MGAKAYCVYEHVFPNGKRYIGISCDAEKRWRYGAGYNEQGKIANAIKKYGWKNVQHNIIVDGLDEEQAKKLEVYLIAALDTIDNGYNTSIGGDNINSTYLNEHVLFMIRKSKELDEIYNQSQLEDDIISYAEKAKTDKNLASIFNAIDEAIEKDYNDYKGFHSNMLIDGALERVEGYWWYVMEFLKYGKPRWSYVEQISNMIFGRAD